MSRPLKCVCGDCKTCRNRAKHRAWAARNQERLREYQKAYREQHRDRLRSAKRAYRAANAATIRARKAAVYQRDKEAIALRRRTEERAARVAQARDWANRNPERRRVIALRDKARRRGVPLDARALEYAQVLAGDPCAYCGAAGTSIDHIEPIARGGSSTWDNLTAACQSCNSSKHARPLLRFMLGLGA